MEQTYGTIEDNTYIYGLVANSGLNNLTEEEYNNIESILSSRPEASQGYIYLLNKSSLEWELVEDPYDAEEDDQDQTGPTQGQYAAAGRILLGVDT